MPAKAEQALQQGWRTSTYCPVDHETCVDVAAIKSRILVRDNANLKGPVLEISRKAWREFTHTVRRGPQQGGPR